MLAICTLGATCPSQSRRSPREFPSCYTFYDWEDRVGAIWDHVSCLNSFINWNCEIPKFLAAEEFPHGDSALTAPPPEPPPVALFSHNLSTSSGSRPAKYAAVMKWGETLKIRERIGMEGLTKWQNELYCRLCKLVFLIPLHWCTSPVPCWQGKQWELKIIIYQISLYSSFCGTQSQCRSRQFHKCVRKMSEICQKIIWNLSDICHKSISCKCLSDTCHTSYIYVSHMCLNL